MLLGMAVTFAGVATLAAVGGGWVVHANEYGRIVAIVVLAVFGVTLLFPSLADRLTRPLRRAGRAAVDRTAGDGGAARHRSCSSFVLGIATGLLWAPCAGPILGLDPDRRGAQRRQRPAPRCCCWPMPPARRPRWRSRCWSAGACSPP